MYFTIIYFIFLRIILQTDIHILLLILYKLKEEILALYWVFRKSSMAQILKHVLTSITEHHCALFKSIAAENQAI